MTPVQFSGNMCTECVELYGHYKVTLPYISDDELAKSFHIWVNTVFGVNTCTRAIRKVKNVCMYNPRSRFIVPDQSFGVFSSV